MAQRRLEEAIHISRASPKDEVKEYMGTERLLERHAKFKFEKEKDGIFTLQFSSDGSVVAMGYGDGTIQTVSSKNASLHKELRVGRPAADAVTMLRFHPIKNDELWASTADGKVYCGDIHSASCRAVITEPGNEINSLCFNREGNALITGGRDHAVRLYDTETRQITRTYEGSLQTQHSDQFSGHSSKIFVIKYHPDDDNVFISGGWDNVVAIWDSRTETGIERYISGPHIAGDGLDIMGNSIVTASWVHSDALQLWDYRHCRLIHNLPFKHGKVGAYLYCCRFNGKKQVIAGGSGTKSIQAIKLKSKQVISETVFGKAVFAIDVHRHKQMVAVGGAGRKMLLLKT